MRKFLIVIVLILSFSKMGNSQEYVVWPSTLGENSLFYRGQRTGLTSYKKLLEMLSVPKKDSIVTSRLFRTLIKLYPNKSWNELIVLSDQQVSHWKKEGLLWAIAECHADTYGCSMPTVRQLMGVIFKEEHLNQEIKIVLRAQDEGRYSYNEGVSAARVLSFFDPIVSTSYDFNIAKTFGKDKYGEDGYVLILNDRKFRNCPEQYQLKANCFINHEEYLEELEYPFWGYVRPDELSGVIVENIKIYKGLNGKVSITDSVSKSVVNLEKRSKLSAETCSKINLLSFNSPKTKRLQATLLNHFQCQ